MRKYSNLEILEKVIKYELTESDLVWVVPAKGCESQALNEPYKLIDEDLFTDYSGEYWCFERGTEWTINEIHPRLKPFVGEEYK